MCPQSYDLKPGQIVMGIYGSMRFHIQECKGNVDDGKSCYETFLSHSGFSGVKHSDDVALPDTVLSKCFTGSG